MGIFTDWASYSLARVPVKSLSCNLALPAMAANPSEWGFKIISDESFHLVGVVRRGAGADEVAVRQL